MALQGIGGLIIIIRVVSSHYHHYSQELTFIAKEVWYLWPGVVGMSVSYHGL